MRYVLADKGKAVKAGFSAATHLSGSTHMMLNEREVAYCAALAGSIEDKVKQLGGNIIEEREAELYIREGGLT